MNKIPIQVLVYWRTGEDPKTYHPSEEYIFSENDALEIEFPLLSFGNNSYIRGEEGRWEDFNHRWTMRTILMPKLSSIELNVSWEEIAENETFSLLNRCLGPLMDIVEPEITYKKL